MMGVPVSRDVGTAGNPDVVMRHDVIEKTRQRAKTAGTACQSTVETHRHHARAMRAFDPELIKTVDQVVAPIPA